MNIVTRLLSSFEPNWLLTPLFRLLLSAGCGGVIGMKQRKRNRPAEPCTRPADGSGALGQRRWQKAGRGKHGYSGAQNKPSGNHATAQREQGHSFY